MSCNAETEKIDLMTSDELTTLTLNAVLKMTK